MQDQDKPEMTMAELAERVADSTAAFERCNVIFLTAMTQHKLVASKVGQVTRIAATLLARAAEAPDLEKCMKIVEASTKFTEEVSGWIGDADRMCDTAATTLREELIRIFPEVKF